jgi:hypothetical protein
MMMQRNLRLWLCMAGLLAALAIGPASAGTHGFRSVVPLHPGRHPFKGNLAYRNSWLSNDFYYNRSYVVLYSFEVIPGQDYTLGFSCPAWARNVAVSLFDKYPYASGARRYTLPMGPALHAGRKTSHYRWRMGIARDSVDTLLYVAVEVPSKEPVRDKLPHTIFLSDRPTNPMSSINQGITCLRGPDDFLLTHHPQPIAYVVQKEDQPAAGDEAAPLPIPGDLIQNSSFADGLNHWRPHRDYLEYWNVKTFVLEAEGLKFSSDTPCPREGIMQRIEKDVSDAQALYLRADIKVVRQALGGTGPEGRTAPVAIAICYQDTNGQKHCEKDIFWRGFYSLEPVEGQQGTNGRKVPENLWYRYIFDMMQLEPKPKYIHFIALESSGWAQRVAWVKNIHLIKKGTSQ